MSGWNEINPPKLHRHHGDPNPVPAFPGAFDYSGFGMGTLYLPEGITMWGTWSECEEVCKKAGLKMVQFDRLAGYTGTYLGD